MPQLNQAFGERIRQIMQDQRLTLRVVANQAPGPPIGPLSWSTVREMQAGVVPNPLKIVGFALAVGVDPDELLRLAGTGLKYDWDEHHRRSAEAEARAAGR